MNLPNLSLSVAEALLRTQAAPEPSATSVVAGPSHPSITISREAGALGNAVAEEVGKRLGLAVYDRAILEKVAEDMRRPAFHLEHVDERSLGWLEDIMTSMLAQYPVNPDTYLKYLIGTVRGLGKVGGCIIVGRGASCILPGDSTVRVRLVADLADRIKVMQKRRNCSEKEARTYITRTEEDRRHFVRKHFGIDPTEPHHYDLLLNTSRLSVDDCAEVIATMYRRLETRLEAHKRPAA